MKLFGWIEKPPALVRNTPAELEQVLGKPHRWSGFPVDEILRELDERIAKLEAYVRGQGVQL